MDKLVKMLADDRYDKFYLTEDEEKELLETLPLMDEKFEDVLNSTEF